MNPSEQAAHRQALATEKLAHATLMQAYATVFVAAFNAAENSPISRAADAVEQFKIRCS